MIQSLSPAEHLTLREREVLNELVLGLSDRQIAMALNLSAATVRHHLKQVYGKLGVHNRTTAALFAVLSGLVEPPPLVA